MKKLLRPKDLLFLGLAGFMDIFEEVRDPFGIAADSCKNLYGWVPEKYKRHNFSRLVKRGLHTGEIDKVVKNGQVYLRLTSTGEEKTTRDFSLFSMQQKKWDRKWRIVIFDIKEVSRRNRDQLRLKLKELGFGMLQESVWISPHDIMIDFREFLEENDLGDYVYLMEVSCLLAGDFNKLINKIWNLDKLNEEYNKLFEEIINVKQMYIKHNDRVKKGQAKVDKKVNIQDNLKLKIKLKKESQEWFKRKMEKIKRRLRQQYLTIILADPCFPKELLPTGWLREKVKKEIFKL